MEKLLDHGTRERPQLTAKHTAVVGIHWQNGIVNPSGAFGPSFAEPIRRSGVLTRTASVLEAARKAGSLVVFANARYWPGHNEVVRNNALWNTVVEMKGFIRGTSDVEVTPQLKRDGDLEVEHSRISVFYGTDILTILLGKGIETVAFTGVATNVAVDHSLRDAVQFGFRTILLEDCCCSSDPAYHDASVMTLRVLSTHVMSAAEFIGSLSAAGA